MSNLIDKLREVEKAALASGAKEEVAEVCYHAANRLDELEKNNNKNTDGDQS